MSHVSALPPASSSSVLEETATEATQYALATLSSFPGLLEQLDGVDVTVGAVSAAALTRILYKAYRSGTLQHLFFWAPRLCRKRGANAVEKGD